MASVPAESVEKVFISILLVILGISVKAYGFFTGAKLNHASLHSYLVM
jgi:hypothetical protein